MRREIKYSYFALFAVILLLLPVFTGCFGRGGNSTVTVDTVYDEPTKITEPSDITEPTVPSESTPGTTGSQPYDVTEPNLAALPFAEAFETIIALYGQTPDLISLAGQSRFPHLIELTHDGFTILFRARDFPVYVYVESLNFTQHIFCLPTLAEDMAATLLLAGYAQLNDTEFYRRYDGTFITVYFEDEDLRVRYSVKSHPEYQSNSGEPAYAGALLGNCSFLSSVYIRRHWGVATWTHPRSNVTVEANIQPIYTPELWAPPHIDLRFFYEQGVPLPCSALGLGGWLYLYGWQRYAVFEYTAVDAPGLRAEAFHLTMEAAGFRHVEGLTYTNGTVSVSLSFSYRSWAFAGAVDAFVTIKCYNMDIEPTGPTTDTFPIAYSPWRGLEFALEWELPAEPRHYTFSTSQLHAMAIKEDGTVWVWGGCKWSVVPVIGDGSNYALEPVMVMENAVSVIAGRDYSMIIDESGVLWAWGDNSFGQLGDGTTETRATPVQVLINVVYATVYSAYFSSHAGGAPRSYAITADGVLWGWGGSGWWDWFGALGDGAIEPRHSPVQILENVRNVIPTRDGGIAITNDGAVWQWNEQHLSPVVIDRLPTVYNQFAVDDSGTLWAIGRSRSPAHWRLSQPVLGDGTTLDRNRPVKIMENVARVVRATSYTYVIDEAGTLWGWGFNNIGFLGDGTTESKFAPVRIMDNVADIVSTHMVDHGLLGFIATYAITADGAIWAWGGSNWNPRIPLLGDGANENRIAPVPVLEGVRV